MSTKPEDIKRQSEEVEATIVSSSETSSESTWDDARFKLETVRLKAQTAALAREIIKSQKGQPIDNIDPMIASQTGSKIVSTLETSPGHYNVTYELQDGGPNVVVEMRDRKAWMAKAKIVSTVETGHGYYNVTYQVEGEPLKMLVQMKNRPIAESDTKEAMELTSEKAGATIVSSSETSPGRSNVATYAMEDEPMPAPKPSVIFSHRGNQQPSKLASSIVSSGSEPHAKTGSGGVRMTRSHRQDE